ncbi:hypothetical protein ACA910_007967 [Epithemia clementina (nom. ined.)]
MNVSIIANEAQIVADEQRNQGSRSSGSQGCENGDSHSKSGKPQVATLDETSHDNTGSTTTTSIAASPAAATTAATAGKASADSGLATTPPTTATTAAAPLTRNNPPSRQPRPSRNSNNDRYEWGKYKTPPGIDFSSEEVMKNPMESDWLGPELKLEGETAWPKVPTQKRAYVEGAEQETSNERRAKDDAEESADNENNEHDDGKQDDEDTNEEQKEEEEEEEDMPDGIADVERLAAKASTIFYEGRQFFNVFQAKQMADYVLGRWGVRLKRCGFLEIHCSYGERHTRPKNSNDSAGAAKPQPTDTTTKSTNVKETTTGGNTVTIEEEAAAALASKKTRVRRSASLSSTSCPFRITFLSRFPAHSKKEQVPRSQNPVRIVSCHLLHNHECSADTYEYAIRKAGIKNRPLGSNHTAPIIRPERRKRKLGEKDGGEGDSDGDSPDKKKRAVLKDPRVEQSVIPWGTYHVPPNASEILAKNPKIKPAEINWLCPPLFEEAKNAWPRPGDINPELVSNNDRFYDKITTVFYPGRQFCNIFQAQQMADYVMGRWGAKVKQHNSTALACCYGHPGLKTKRKWESGEPMRRNKTIPAISATDCPFHIGFTYRHAHFRNGASTGVTRAENPVRLTRCFLKHNHDCSAESLRALKQVSGAYTQNMELSAWQELVDLLSDDDDETDQNSAIRDILRPYFPHGVPITSSVIANVKTKARALRAKGRAFTEGDANSQGLGCSDAQRVQQSSQPLDMSCSLTDHFTLIMGFDNTIKNENNPEGRLEWYCPPDGWDEHRSSENESRKGRWDVDHQTGELTLYPAAEKSFWRRTHYDPVLIKDDGALLYATLEKCRSYTVEASLRLMAACEADEAGLIVRMDNEHWIKAGIEFLDGKIRLSCVVTNIFSDWSSHSSSWPCEVDYGSVVIRRVGTRREEAPRQQHVVAECMLRVHCRGHNFVVEAKHDAEESWELVRLAHLSPTLVDMDDMTTAAGASTALKNVVESEQREEEGRDDDDKSNHTGLVGPKPGMIWVGVFACCPQDQQGGHAVFSTFHVVEGSGFDK